MQHQHGGPGGDPFAEDIAQLPRRHRACHPGDPGAPRLPGGRPGDRTPAPQSLLRALTLPAGHATRGLPRDELVGPDLGREFDRQLGTLRLRDPLHDSDCRIRYRGTAALFDARRDAALADAHDHALGNRSGAVRQQQRLPDPDAAHRPRMETLVTVDHRGFAGRRNGGGVEQGRRHAISGR